MQKKQHKMLKNGYLNQDCILNVLALNITFQIYQIIVLNCITETSPYKSIQRFAANIYM